jgi:squalene-associated FAD-dependent desaturase
VVTRAVVVVGGGLAGITAALRLSDRGCQVTLLEARPRLGGLTSSFRRGELWVDNGQHVFMRCCTSYRALLDRLGVTSLTTLQPRLRVPVVDARSGRRATLRRDPLPAPLHLGRSLASFAPLPLFDRLAAARGALAMRRVDRQDPRTDDRSFASWLDASGQSPAARAALWDLVGVATMNVRADEASLAVAATVFQIGMLEHAGAGDLGWSLVPLQQLHGDAATTALHRAGADVRVRARVEELRPAPDGWMVVTSTDELRADDVVVATDPVHMERLLPDGAVPQAAGWSARLGTSPIVNLHVVYDRRVLHDDVVAGVGTPVQWVFDRTAQSGLRTPGGQCIGVSLSAADDVVDVPVAELRARFVPELERLLPDARQARVTDFFVTRERAATFRPRPGTARLRPAATTAYPGLFLAGAHCATGWPATMESAVRSGNAAADALLATAAMRPAVAA